MALTVARRKVKTRTIARNSRQQGITIFCVGAALFILNRRRRVGLVLRRRVGLLLLVAGATLTNEAEVILGRLEHPYAFRPMFPYGRRCLESWSDDTYHDRYRFPKNAVKQHLNYYILVWNFPHVVDVPYQATQNGRPTIKTYRFNLDEIYLMFLRYLATPVRQYEVAVEFGRCPAEVCKAIRWFHHKLARVSRSFLQNHIQPWFDLPEALKCRDALRRKGCPINSALGNMDGVNKRVANPSVAWLNRELYNGHKRHCGLAWAGVVLPNGLALLVEGPSPGRRHDAAVAAEHMVYEKLEALGTFPGLRGCFGADSAYPLFWPVIPAFAPARTNNQVMFNQDLSRSRICIEWLFGQLILQFSSLDWNIRCKVLASPVKEAYLNAAFLTNLLNIRFPNIISQYFKCKPPSLETYLNVPEGSLN